MESVPRFFLLDRLVERSAGRRSVREHAGRSPDCVARMRRRLRFRRSRTVQKKSRRRGAIARRSVSRPRRARHGGACSVVGIVPKRQRRVLFSPARDAPGRVGSGGFGAGGVRQGAPPLGILPAGQSLRADAGQRSPWTAPMTMAARLHSSSMATARMAVSMARASPIHHSR